MYRLTQSTSILRLTDNAGIPADESNTDYKDYIAWLSEGNTPEPFTNAAQPVYRCDPWQIRKALTNLGLRNKVEDAVASSGDLEIKDGWAHALVFSSADQLVISIGSYIGKTAEETASVIKYAGTL